MTKKPTIGRIVMYVPTEKEKEKWNGADLLPAIIVRVWNPGMVNLKVVTDAPADEWLTSVELSSEKKPRSWHWPELPTTTDNKAPVKTS